jgi:transposase-like protein
VLSKLRKDVRDGTIRGRLPKAAAPSPAPEIARLQQLEREHALLQEEHDLLEKSHLVLRRSKADLFAFIHAERATYGIARL